MILLILGLALFLGMHSAQIFASSPRAAAIERFGKLGWMAAYSLISALGLFLIVIGYGNARENPAIVYETYGSAIPISHILMAIAMVLIVATYLPMSSIKKSVGGHPMLAAVILWAIAHLVVNGTYAGVVLFGSFLVWAIIDRIAVMFRTAPATRANEPDVIYDITAIIIGLGIYTAAILGAHEWLVGASPFG